MPDSLEGSRPIFVSNMSQVSYAGLASADSAVLESTGDAVSQADIGSNEASVLPLLRKVRTAITETLGMNPVSREPSMERHQFRDYFNMTELQVSSIFERYDADGSQELCMNELRKLLRDCNDGQEPSEEELRWIMVVADRDMNDKISRKELLLALQMWHSYILMPDSLHVLFDNFDTNSNGYLDEQELQALLTTANGGNHVAIWEVREVMQIADRLHDGQLGRYELLGAVAAWYINVGRKPTDAMSLAFIANNRSGGVCHMWLHILMILFLVPGAYFPLVVAYSSERHCAKDLPDLLWADGFLWVALVIFFSLKLHWVQIINCFVKPQRAWTLVRYMSWYLIFLEIALISLLTAVEALGTVWALQEYRAGNRELLNCNAVATSLPVDMWLSWKEKQVVPYESFLDFCRIWFTFNFGFNLVCLFFYYVFVACRYRELSRTDGILQQPLPI